MLTPASGSPSFPQTFAGWILTIIVAALISAAITSFAVYSPSKVYADDNNYVAKYLDTQGLAMIKQMNTSTGGVAVRATLNVSARAQPQCWLFDQLSMLRMKLVGSGRMLSKHEYKVS